MGRTLSRSSVSLASDGVREPCGNCADERSRALRCMCDVRSQRSAKVMLVFGSALIGAALALVVAEAHLSSGGVIGAVASAAAVGGIVLLLLAARAGAAVVLLVAMVAAGSAIALLLLASTISCARRAPAPARQGGARRTCRRRPVRWRVRVAGLPRRGPVARQGDPIHDGVKLHEGDRVVVEGVNGLTLRVRKAEEWELNP